MTTTVPMAIPPTPPPTVQPMSMIADPSDAELQEQENRLQLTRFTNDDAIALGMRVVAIGQAEGLPITVDVRKGMQQAFHAALAGTAPDNDAWVERKVRAVQRFGISSFRLGCQLRAAGRTITQAYLVNEDDYAAHGGAFPLSVDGVGMVGVLTVSGLPQRDDHALVIRVITDWLKDEA